MNTSKIEASTKSADLKSPLPPLVTVLFSAWTCGACDMVSYACTPHEFTCIDNEVRECLFETRDPLETNWEARVDSCRSGTCVHRDDYQKSGGYVCVYPEVSCEDETHRECVGNTIFECGTLKDAAIEEQTCAHECDYDENGNPMCVAKKGACEDGQTTCLEDSAAIVTCKDGRWTEIDYCMGLGDGCIEVDGHALCVFDKEPCAPEGLRRCDDRLGTEEYLLTCQGGYWTVQEYFCDYNDGLASTHRKCYQNDTDDFICVYDETPCTDGAQKCHPDLDYIYMVCEDGHFTGAEYCPGPKAQVCVQESDETVRCEDL